MDDFGRARQLFLWDAPLCNVTAGDLTLTLRIGNIDVPVIALDSIPEGEVYFAQRCEGHEGHEYIAVMNGASRPFDLTPRIQRFVAQGVLRGVLPAK